MADLTDLQQPYGIKNTTNPAPPAAPTGSNMNPASTSVVNSASQAPSVNQPTAPAAPALGVGASNSTSPLKVGSPEYFANEEAKRKADILKKRTETPISASIFGPTQTFSNQLGATPLDSIIKPRTDLLSSYGLGKLS
jgi:hypothetical protein